MPRSKCYVVKCYIPIERKWVNPFRDKRTYKYLKNVEKAAAHFAEYGIHTRIVTVYREVK